MSSTEEAEYAAFEDKVKRTVYVDNLSPQVTESVLTTALNQFGNVQNVQFIPNYTEPKNMPRCALVEMENVKQAKQIISEMSNFPFMMSGMPRPVRARDAEIGMFDNRPRNPGRRIICRWLDPQDPDFRVAKKLTNLVKKHNEEAAFLLEVNSELSFYIKFFHGCMLHLYQKNLAFVDKSLTFIHENICSPFP